MQSRTRYDAIPYPSHPFPQSRPERLAAVAWLFGLEAPQVERCRVLELGCSMGGNLILMAQNYPEARFVGIDASARQIGDGWKTVDALGLKNVELKHMDILDIGGDLGEFDYIVSHGVYSWVPPAVQHRMLEVCKRHLAPNGVAYVSYNTYPGWHIRGIVRDMMLYRGMQFSDPATQLAQAKSLVEFVAKSSSGDDAYGKLLQSELGVLARSDDYYLHHDHLEENNHPLYFHEFARRLGVNGLQYLGEADFSTMVSSNFAPEVAKMLQDLGANDILQMEQHMDFVRCRYFRQTLVCHSAARLNRQLGPGLVKNLLLASNALPESDAASPEAPDQQTFRIPGGRGITCRSPVTKQALRTLHQRWPAFISFPELFAASRSAGAADEEFLANEMLACMAAGVVEWRVSPEPFTTAVTRKPATIPSARLQAARGRSVTNLRGETVTLDEIHCTVLRHLEGKHDLTQLTGEVLAFLLKGGHQLRREHDNTIVTDEAEMRSLLANVMEKVLHNLGAKALLLREQQPSENHRSSAAA